MSHAHPDPTNTYYENDEDEPPDSQLGWGTALVLLLLIAAMLTTLVWPLLWQMSARYRLPPTPTPLFLQEA